MAFFKQYDMGFFASLLDAQWHWQHKLARVIFSIKIDKNVGTCERYIIFDIVNILALDLCQTPTGKNTKSKYLGLRIVLIIDIWILNNIECG